MKNGHAFVRINTILIPDDGIQGQLVKLAEKIIGDQKDIFHIDNKKYFAHITLFSPEYPVDNLEKVISKVEQISKQINEIVLEFEGFNTDLGYVGLEFKNSKQVENLHKLVLKELNSLREGRIRDKYVSEMAEGKYSNQEVNHIKRYGYHNVLESFHPHLTLARFETEELAQDIKSNMEEKLSFSEITFPYLAISEMGPNGTCTKILRKYSLLK